MCTVLDLSVRPYVISLPDIATSLELLNRVEGHNMICTITRKLLHLTFHGSYAPLNFIARSILLNYVITVTQTTEQKFSKRGL